MDSTFYLIFFTLIFVFISLLILTTVTYDKQTSIQLTLKDKHYNNELKCGKKDPVTKNDDLIIPENIQLVFRSREEDLKKMNVIHDFSNNYTKNSISKPDIYLRHNPYVVTKYKPCTKNTTTKSTKSKKIKNTKNVTNEIYDSMYYDKNKTLKTLKTKEIKWLPVKNSECLI